MSNHIFYKELKNLRKKNKLFDEFSEMLRTLSYTNLQRVVGDMSTFNIELREKNSIFDYIDWAKLNHVDFINRLNHRLK